MQMKLFSYKPVKKENKGYISGGNMKHLVKLSEVADVKFIPLDKKADMVDDRHITILTIESENGIMGIPYPKEHYGISAKAIKEMGFEDDEVFLAGVDNMGNLILTDGKDYYKFTPEEYQPVSHIPPLEYKNKYVTKGKKFDEIYSTQKGKLDSNYHTRFDFGNGVDGVLKHGDEQIGPKVRMTDAKQNESGKVMLPANRLNKLGDVADEIEIEMDSDYPARLTFADPTYKATYLVAPRIENENRKPKARKRTVKATKSKPKTKKKSTLKSKTKQKRRR